MSWTDSYSSCAFYSTTGVGREALHYKQTDAAQGFFKKSPSCTHRPTNSLNPQLGGITFSKEF